MDGWMMRSRSRDRPMMLMLLTSDRVARSCCCPVLLTSVLSTLRAELSVAALVLCQCSKLFGFYFYLILLTNLTAPVLS